MQGIKNKKNNRGCAGPFGLELSELDYVRLKCGKLKLVNYIGPVYINISTNQLL